jgi:hypothetical protein
MYWHGQPSFTLTGGRLKLTKVNKSVSEIENMLSTDYQTYCKLGDTLWKDDINPIFL